MKKIICIFFLSIIIILQCACDKNISIDSNTGNKKKVIKNLDIMVTNKDLYNIVKDIAGDDNNLEFMLKNENENEDFTYTDDGTSNIGKQDLFIYTGAGFENWIDDFLNKVDKSKVSIINSSRGVSILNYNNKSAKKLWSKKSILLDGYR
ncbi:metal ABC transporter solute-binding protein, Zn/Mn family [Clostridium arbusti]|uniref:metal ABC transporter solute-binding protein, Zn/Mn family n=1 Tax=Clostridium arbusti TaxID=1137848 RepID=UPI0002E9684C|nr:zinc ABC transporter substrate-binding protein [Clostridium arbusti]